MSLSPEASLDELQHNLS